MSTRALNSWRKSVAITATTAVSASLLVLAPSAAGATDGPYLEGQLSGADVNQSLEDLKVLNQNLIADPVPAGVDTASSVEIPKDPSDGIVLTGEGGSSLKVTLPNADEAGAGETLIDGTVVYPASDSANAVIPTYTGVQMLTTISNGEAPTQYSYDVGLDPTQRLELVDGGAAVINADGSTEFLVSAPWAKDANGQDVATYYEIDGDTLTQVVSHTSVEHAAYPIVADPVWIPAFVYRCLIGIGMNGPAISRMMEKGTFSAILAAGGYAAVRCVMGR